MWRVLLSRVGELLGDVALALRRPPVPAERTNGHSNGVPALRGLRKLVVTDGVSRTLFEEYSAHRDSNRGDEETGWLLLGHRDHDHATALATLPAGTLRQAGVAHVQFNTSGQALGSRIVRQLDRRLTILGVVHTHPGSLRHPSDGDYRGDSQWVCQLRGREGVFGIGTVDEQAPRDRTSRQPKPHRQVLGPLSLSWYSLAEGDTRYRPLPVELTLGPDLARSLRVIWPVMEDHADELDRLVRQQNGVKFALLPGKSSTALAVTLPLAEPGANLSVLLEGQEVRYVLQRGSEYLEASSSEPRLDRAVYLLLAQLAGQAG